MGLFVIPSSFQNDNKGRAASFATYDFYETGTFDRKNVYSDSELTSVLPNPVVADRAGRFPVMYLESDIAYRVVYSERTTASSQATVSEIWTLDDVLGSVDQSTLKSGAFTEVGEEPTQIPPNSSIQSASSNFLNYDASSTANAIVLTTPYATKRTALIVGEELSFWATATNTGASTITIDSIGTFDAKTTMSGDPKAGYIRPNEPTCFYYDGVNLVIKPPSNFTYSKSETSLVPGAGTLNLSRNGHTVTATWSQASINLFTVTAGTALFNIPDGYRPINNHEAATNTKGTSTSNGSTILATSDGLMIAYLYAENLTLNYSFSATWLTSNDYPAQ